MTDEEIKQNALDYRNHTKESGETIVEASRRQFAFEAGAHSRDEEVNHWKKSYEELAEIANDLQTEKQTLMIENAKLRNPWFNVKDRLPDEGDDVLICNWAGKVIRNEYVSKGDIKYMKDHPELYTSWMPVPKP